MHNNIPKELASDNGAEFKNKIFNDFCKENNIRYVHGVPYSPHSIGVIERFNYIIKKYLSKEYICNGENNIDFESCRMKNLNYYNNKIHGLLGTSPNIAHSITENDEINKINELKEKEFNKVNSKRNFLKRNDTCLLNPKFIKIGKNTLIYNRVKKGKFDTKIPVRIISNSPYGYYLVKIDMKIWEAIVKNNIDDSSINKNNINQTKLKKKKKRNHAKIKRNKYSFLLILIILDI